MSLGLAAAGAHAGGQFDVDDAGTLDAGQCQYELWAGQSRDPGTPLALRTRFWHAGPSCAVGPVELGWSLDRVDAAGQRTTYHGPQFKWTFLGKAPDARWSAAVSMTALVAAPGRDGGGRAGGQFVLPVTWHAVERLYVHANLGADWATGSGQRFHRAGVQGEWAVCDAVSLIAERNRSFGNWTSRIGARFNVTPLVSVDVAAAQTGPAKTRTWIVGLNQEFGR